MLDRIQIKVTTAGSAGVAVGSQATSVPVRGRILAVHVDYHASAPSTTDLILSVVDAPAITVLTLTNVNTDGWYYPRRTPQGVTGADLSALTYLEPILAWGALNVALAQCDALTDAVVVTVYLDRD